MSDIKSEAAAWAVRVDAGPPDEARRLELETWLAGDPRRRGAFLRAQAGLRLLDQSRDLRDVSGPDHEIDVRRTTVDLLRP